ncbi:MAG: B12-binding domain-containing radical SAM protein [Deltaproteobacteria bacterium]|nr:B12-binding domain-containing radical SAM protein [Deltaproteobacteria bacterium]
MRILFVKPNMGLVDGRPYHDRGRMEPLTFAVLAGFTPERHQVELCDDRFEPVPYDEPWDVVGINVEIYTARRAYEIADRFRAAGAKVVLGGFHVSMIPDEAQAHADAIALGDSDAVWTRILDDIEAGALRPRYPGTPCQGAVSGIRTRWEIFRGKRYLPMALTQFGRGCVNSCEYCATGNLYRGRNAHRPPAEVAAELERDGRTFVFFVDDNLVADVPAVKQLCRELIPLKIRWTAQASLNFASDGELLDLMMQSGCQGLVVGFESRDPSDLRAMNKQVNLGCGDYDAVVERIRASGLLLWAAFLLGYDHETERSVRETVDWALSKKFAFSAFNILMPYPATPFYERMKREGRLLYGGRWWLHDDYRFGHGAFAPKHMSAEQLGELGLWARLRHNTVLQIMRRATDRRTNSKDIWSLLTYFAYNPLFRDEMLKKHGMPLGYRGFERTRADAGLVERARDALLPDELSSALLEQGRRVLTRISRVFD